MTIAQNYHVPIDTYRETWDRLASGEVFGGGLGGLFGGGAPRRPTNGYLGVIRDEKAANCRIAEVSRNSPAARAGIKEGDVITKVDDQKIETFDDLRAYLGRRRPDDIVVITVLRDRETLSFRVKLDRFPAE